MGDSPDTSRIARVEYGGFPCKGTQGNGRESNRYPLLRSHGYGSQEDHEEGHEEADHSLDQGQAEGQEHDEEGLEVTRYRAWLFAYRRERPARSKVERAGLLFLMNSLSTWRGGQSPLARVFRAAPVILANSPLPRPAQRVPDIDQSRGRC